MKKLFVMILLTILSATAVQAQVKLSAKVGTSFNVSDMSFNDPDVLTSLRNPMGFHAGLAVKVKLIPILYLQGDVLYNNSSYKFNIVDAGYVKYTNHTIDVPVTVGLQVLFLRIYAGPSFSFKLGTKEMKSINSNAMIENASNHNVYGYQAGLGFDIAKRVTIDLSYNGKWKPTKHTIKVDGVNVINEIKDRQLTLSVGFFIL